MEYYINMWDVDSSEEYDVWFDSLDEDSKIIIDVKVKVLKTFGPNLPRPYSDVLHGSKYKNLKELRANNAKHIFRVSYIFDKERKAFLLLGGDKKGKNENDFYKELITLSEQLIEKYNLK